MQDEVIYRYLTGKCSPEEEKLLASPIAPVVILKRKKESGGLRPLPDLIMVDGGKGQVHSAIDELEALGLDYIPVVGLAERNEEIVFPDDRPNLVLDKADPALRILIALRDECHRFATSANQRMRSRDAGFALLQSVEGVGRKRAEMIMKECGSIEGLLEMGPGELARRTSIPLTVAERIVKQLTL